VTIDRCRLFSWFVAWAQAYFTLFSLPIFIFPLQLIPFFSAFQIDCHPWVGQALDNRLQKIFKKDKDPIAIELKLLKHAEAPWMWMIRQTLSSTLHFTSTYSSSSSKKRPRKQWFHSSTKDTYRNISFCLHGSNSVESTSQKPKLSDFSGLSLSSRGYLHWLLQDHKFRISSDKDYRYRWSEQ
jgi:hypothetical protein